MRFMVAVASKHGGTAEIGHSIATQLRRYGEVIEIDPAGVVDVTNCDAIVIGGAVYADAWMPSATALTERLEVQLRERPVFMFCSGPIGSAAHDHTVPAQISATAKRIGARSAIVFGGKVDRGVLGAVERTVMRMKGAPDGDWRDGREVTAWVETIARELNQPLNQPLGQPLNQPLNQPLGQPFVTP